MSELGLENLVKGMYFSIIIGSFFVRLGPSGSFRVTSGHLWL